MAQNGTLALQKAEFVPDFADGVGVGPMPQTDLTLPP